MEYRFKYTHFCLYLVLLLILGSCRDHSPVMNAPRNIRGVSGFQRTFNDDNKKQMASATALGVQPVRNLEQARRHKALEQIASCETFKVDSLTHSLPFLTHGAAALLDDLGQGFLDSLSSKGLNPYRIVVTSVLRTSELIKDLKKSNVNSIENSTHCYGTTFDVSWKSFQKADPDSWRYYEPVGADTLKLVLAEVLRDFQKGGRCYVKYEVKQGCFHITSRE